MDAGSSFNWVPPLFWETGMEPLHFFSTWPLISIFPWPQTERGYPFLALALLSGKRQITFHCSSSECPLLLSFSLPEVEEVCFWPFPLCGIPCPPGKVPQLLWLSIFYLRLVTVLPARARKKRAKGRKTKHAAVKVFSLSVSPTFVFLSLSRLLYVNKLWLCCALWQMLAGHAMM